MKTALLRQHHPHRCALLKSAKLMPRFPRRLFRGGQNLRSKILVFSGTKTGTKKYLLQFRWLGMTTATVPRQGIEFDGVGV